jgi:vanillate O-demethylase ferredoxin subunit
MARTTSARLVRRVPLGDDVCALTFRAVGAAFDGLEPGAHVDLHLPGGLVRQYSLTGWDDAGRELSVAVQREPDGRGGSLAAHALAVGDPVELGGPRNTFRLVPSTGPVVLVGGGIGITPLVPMARALRDEGRDFHLHYLVRTRAHAALLPALEELRLGDRCSLHCDDVEGLPDLAALVERYPADTSFHVCGPEAVLDAVRKASEELGRGIVSTERFAAFPEAHRAGDRPFTVVLGSTGQEVPVPAGTSVLRALLAAGRDVAYSCGEGVCGTCITEVLAGEVDHRDGVLTEDEWRAGDCMAICVSRARGPRLVLDL